MARNNELPECRVQVPADIADLVEIHTKEQAIARLVQQRDARPENPGKASALARELGQLKADASCPSPTARLK